MFPEDFPISIYQPIGFGSFGTVYEGVDKETKMVRAVKVVDTQKIHALSHYAETEMKIMMRLQSANHPSLVNMYGCYKLGEHSVALVLEFCELGDLGSFMKRQPKMRVHEGMAKQLMQDIAFGLNFLKSNNIIHRDLKPQNLLLAKKNRKLCLKLADFGFAKDLGDYDQMLKSFVGSPLYLAPEVWDCHMYTTKSDLWSVGVIFYEIIFGFTCTLPIQSRCFYHY